MLGMLMRVAIVIVVIVYLVWFWNTVIQYALTFLDAHKAYWTIITPLVVIALLLIWLVSSPEKSRS